MRWYATCCGRCQDRQTCTGRWMSTYDEYEFEVVYEGPFDCIPILFVFFFRGPALYECFSNERVDGRCGGGSYMRSFGRERARPEYDTPCNQSSDQVLNIAQTRTFVRNGAVI